MSLSLEQQEEVMEALRGAGGCNEVRPDANQMPEPLRQYHPKHGDGVAFYYETDEDKTYFIGKILLAKNWGARAKLEPLEFTAIEHDPPTVRAVLDRPFRVGDHYIDEVVIRDEGNNSAGVLLWKTDVAGAGEFETAWEWPKKG